jgi:dihydropyrimidinase
MPRYVLTRGHVSVVEDKFQGEAGHGKFVGREAKNPVNRALSTWKDIVAPRKIERAGIPATGV